MSKSNQHTISSNMKLTPVCCDCGSTSGAEVPEDETIVALRKNLHLRHRYVPGVKRYGNSHVLVEQSLIRTNRLQQKESDISPK